MRQKQTAVSWEREIRRAKAVNAAVFFLTLVLMIVITLALVVSGASCRFTSEKWLREPQKRTRIVSDLLRRSDPTGRTLAEVTKLLGRGEVSAAQDGDFLLRYPLGVDPVFVPQGNAVLEIVFQNGVASVCRIAKA